MNWAEPSDQHSNFPAGSIWSQYHNYFHPTQSPQRQDLYDLDSNIRPNSYAEQFALNSYQTNHCLGPISSDVQGCHQIEPKIPEYQYVGLPSDCRHEHLTGQYGLTEREQSICGLDCWLNNEAAFFQTYDDSITRNLDSFNTSKWAVSDETRQFENHSTSHSMQTGQSRNEMQKTEPMRSSGTVGQPYYSDYGHYQVWDEYLRDSYQIEPTISCSISHSSTQPTTSLQSHAIWSDEMNNDSELVIDKFHDSSTSTPESVVAAASAALANFHHRGSLQLWQFLVALLDDSKSKHLICWTGRTLEFKLNEPEEVARLWGIQKNRPAMNYDKLSRSLRYYYEKGIMQKVAGERYVYRFVYEPELLFALAFPSEETSVTLGTGKLMSKSTQSIASNPRIESPQSGSNDQMDMWDHESCSETANLIKFCPVSNSDDQFGSTEKQKSGWDDGGVVAGTQLVTFTDVQIEKSTSEFQHPRYFLENENMKESNNYCASLNMDSFIDSSSSEIRRPHVPLMGYIDAMNFDKHPPIAYPWFEETIDHRRLDDYATTTDWTCRQNFDPFLVPATPIFTSDIEEDEKCYTSFYQDDPFEISLALLTSRPVLTTPIPENYA